MGLAQGDWLAGRADADPLAGAPGPPGWSRRAAGILPAALALSPRVALTAVVWGLVAAAGVGEGYLDGIRRRRRTPTVVVSDAAPSEWRQWRGRAACRVTAWPRRTSRGWRAPAVLVAGVLAGDEIPGEGPAPGDGVLLDGRGAAPGLWAIVAGEVALRIPTPAAVPGGFDEAAHLAARGIRWVGRWTPDGAPTPEPQPADHLARLGGGLGAIRARARGLLGGGLPEPEASLATAVLLGARGSEDPALREDMTRLGLAHLYAVSGLHVGIVMGVLAALATALPLGWAGRRLALFAPLPLYVVLTGMPGSVLRASGMAALAIAGALAGRRPRSLHILGLLFWAQCLYDPDAAADVGVRLSFLAVGGILAVMDRLGDVLARLRGAGRWIATALAVSCGAQWLTLPVVAGSFGRLPPLSPLINILAVPWFGAGVWLAATGLVVGAVWEAGGLAILGLAWLVWRPLLAGAMLAAGTLGDPLGLPVPHPLRLAGFVPAAVGALLLRPGPGRPRPWRWAPPALAALSVLVIALPGPPRDGVEAVQFAVGQGDCAWVRLPDGWTALIDTGPGWEGGDAVARDLVPWLRRRGLRRLDSVVLTHGHADHTAGSGSLAAEVTVGAWWTGGSAEAPGGSGPGVRVARRGDVLHAADGWSLRCLYPGADGPAAGDENDASAVIGLFRGERLRMLWTGDLEEEGEAALVALGLGDVRDGGVVWKAGHHGSETSGSRPLLDALRPRLIVISCGIANRHGHPSHRPYEVAGRAVPTLRTDLHGTVSLRLDDDGDVAWATAIRRLDGSRGRPESPAGAAGCPP